MQTNRLSEILKLKGLSQKEFAAMANTSPQYISGICTGKLTVSIKQLAVFAELLEVPVDTLIISQFESAILTCPHCGRPIRISISGCDDNEKEMD